MRRDNSKEETREASESGAETRGGQVRTEEAASEGHHSVANSVGPFRVVGLRGFFICSSRRGPLCILSNHPAARGSPEGGAACEVLSSGSERPQ